MPENFTLTNDEFTGDLTSVTCVTSEDVDFSSLDEAQKQALVDIATPYVTRVQELLKQKPLIRIGIYCGTGSKTVDRQIERPDIQRTHKYL